MCDAGQVCDAGSGGLLTAVFPEVCRLSHSQCSGVPRRRPTRGCSEAASFPELGTCPLALLTDLVPAAPTLWRHRVGQPERPVSPPGCGSLRPPIVVSAGCTAGDLVLGARGGCPVADTPPPAGLRLPPLLEGASLLWSRRGAHRLRLRAQVRRHVEEVSPGSPGRGGHGRGQTPRSFCSPLPFAPRVAEPGPRAAAGPVVAREDRRTPSVLPGSCRTVTTTPPGSSTCS